MVEMNRSDKLNIELFDLMDFYPKLPITKLDISQFLTHGIMVKEKEFKQRVNDYDFSVFRGKAVSIYCLEDAIIPSWVYLVLSEKLLSNAAYFDWKDQSTVLVDLWIRNLENCDFKQFSGKKIVVPGNPQIPPSLYLNVSKLLSPHVQSLLYGDPSLPKVIFKRKD